MVWLETKGEVFRIRFRFGGAKHADRAGENGRPEALSQQVRLVGQLRFVCLPVSGYHLHVKAFSKLS